MMEKGDLIINSGGYRVLNSYMVLGVTIKLDPESPQADDLRHLLNVVSGRARDEQGRLSEPIVKEELAIVEFLTAKNASKPSSNASAGNANGQQRAEGTDENTPVDLLLGLAKTNTGRRAAEEEKRQLRLQQRRELEEQRMAQRRSISAGSIATNGNVMSSSPWGYVAPQMPGLDVHQPFGGQGQQQGGDRRLPRPLQPPGGTGRPNNGGSRDNNMDLSDGSVTGWSPDNPFGFTENKQVSPNFGGPAGNLMPSPHNAFAAAAAAAAGVSGSNNQLSNISPYQEMTLNLPTPEEQLSNMAGQGADGLFPSTNEFGNADVGSFDFSNLGVSQQGMDMGFNPFAIQQTGDEA